MTKALKQIKIQMHYALSFPRNSHMNFIFYAFMSEHIKNILPCSEGGDII